MRIFYILLSIILLTTTQAKSQARGPLPDTDHKVVKKYYPNPAVSYIVFEIDREPNQAYTLQIYSFLGKMVKNIPDIADRYTLNLSDLYRGLYTFQLKDQSGHVTDSGIFQLNK
jgi:hypothetical protein